MKQINLWYLLQSGPATAAENMAWDQALLEAASRTGRPLLRFYSWTEPAASFGYFQRHADAATWTTLRPLVRRPTGGGLVPHDLDWTYSLVFPPGSAWWALRAVESYRRLHEWIAGAFQELKIRAVLATTARVGPPGCCFTGADQFDVIAQDRKLAGAAQRRTRQGLLIQGSIQPPPGVAKVDWQMAFCARAQSLWDVQWEPFDPDTDLRDRAEILAREKYSQPAYNQRR